MRYKTFQDIQLSQLGFGAMRLPTMGNDPNAPIDEDRTGEMVEHAMRKGINYFDTAYGYHDGASEIVMGRVLKQYPRNSYYIATKFPGYDLANMEKVEEIFEEQLKKTGMEHFDFYMFHNVCEMNIEPYLDKKYGIMDYLRRQKENGRITHLGFSAHGRLDVMKRFLETYGSEMEFCQIQLNYLDWKLQEAKEKVELLNSYNIPIWVMEPLRGGKLVSLPEGNMQKLREIRPSESAVGWAFRFLQTIPEVTVILSGMSDMTQLQENLDIFEKEQPITAEENGILDEIANGMMDILPCTACRYCMTHRSCKLDIPNLLFMYNELRFSNGFITQMGVGALKEDEKPHACIGCRSCEAVCPQQIKISEVMSDFVARMNRPVSW